MTAIDAETQQLVDIAVAGAPALTSDQITDLRRLLKPETRIPAMPKTVRRPVTRPERRAA